MQSCLEIITEKVDVILFQEVWISREHTTISHLSFYNMILSELNLRSQVCAFIT